ncbi:MAG: MEDS domain-containing protein [Terracidiphilus sp.]
MRLLSAEQSHLDGGEFDVERMMNTLEDALGLALKDGYAGLWATGELDSIILHPCHPGSIIST